jgi:malate dehydrogenase (oxaloacetate-decarboxylating)
MVRKALARTSPAGGTPVTTVDDQAVHTEMSTTQAPVTDEEIFRAHEGGKLGIEVRSPIADPRSLAIVYTPGVAKVSRAIAEDASLAAKYTWAHRLVAVVSDGTAVLGLGDIGASASLPVMEGKAALFKTFGGLESIPLVLDTTDVDEIVETLVRLRPSFGAVNLEDVAAPRCFELERRLIEALDCPVMHDDQHGTAVVLLAALRGANEVLSRDLGDERVVIVGAGAAGVACAKILLAAGVGDVTLLDSRGIVHSGRDNLNPIKQEMAEVTNKAGLQGGMAEALDGADVFVGLSAATVEEELIATMAANGIVFALSNPDPEIHPEVAARHAAIVATGRSDFPNQINNVLAFPGIFRGALDAGARRITENMKLAAAEAIYGVASEDLSKDKIVPSALDPRVAPEVAEAVARAAREDGVA